MTYEELKAQVAFFEAFVEKVGSRVQAVAFWPGVIEHPTYSEAKAVTERLFRQTNGDPSQVTFDMILAEWERIVKERASFDY